MSLESLSASPLTPAYAAPSSESSHLKDEQVQDLGLKALKKTVRFSNQVKVILIPSRTEYFATGEIVKGRNISTRVPLARLMWWTHTELSSFKTILMIELRPLRGSPHHLSVKDASTVLYQPSESTVPEHLHKLYRKIHHTKV